MQERRKFVRLDTSLDVSYQVVQQRGVTASVTKDISAGGIRIRLHESVPVGTLLNLQVSLRGLPTPIACQGRVVWIQARSVAGAEGKISHEAGVEFVGLNPADREAILQYVVRHLQRTGTK